MSIAGCRSSLRALYANLQISTPYRLESSYNLKVTFEYQGIDPKYLRFEKKNHVEKIVYHIVETRDEYGDLAEVNLFTALF